MKKKSNSRMFNVPVYWTNSNLWTSIRNIFMGVLSFIIRPNQWRYRLITHLQSAITNHIQPLSETGTINIMPQIDRKFGVEIEFVHERSITRAIYKEIEEKFPDWEIKSDMSIRPYGTEINSPILSGDEGLTAVSQMVDYLNSNSGIRVNKSCGLHVHVDAGDLTAAQVISVSQRYTEGENSFFDKLMQNHRNNDNRYCYSSKFNTLRSGISSNILTIKDVFSSLTGYRDKTCFDKYRKVNISCRAHGTIEFRHHHATLNKDELLNWVKFVTNFVEITKSSFSDFELGNDVFLLPTAKENEAQEIMSKHGEMNKFFYDFSWEGATYTFPLQDALYYHCKINLRKEDYEVFLNTAKNKEIFAKLAEFGFSIKQVTNNMSGYRDYANYVTSELHYNDQPVAAICSESKRVSSENISKILDKIEKKIQAKSKEIDLFQGIPNETIYYYSKVIEKKNKKSFLLRQKLINIIEESPSLYD